MQKIHNHGDLILYPVKALKPAKDSKIAKLHVILQSTPTGNRHEVTNKTENIYLWEKDGKEFVRCDKDFILQHVGGDCEHGVQHVSAGTYEIRHEMEHDPWRNELKIVID